MAEPLVNQFGAEVPRRIAALLAAAGEFDSKGFTAAALKGFSKLNLMQRAIHLADVMHDYLPKSYEAAVALVLRSLGPPLQQSEDLGMTPFLYLPHTLWVARHGLDHFELSMQAQYELTQRFSAEFSIRPFIERHPQKTLALLKAWTRDANPHVRRLVSEGTRPRLPWAMRLRQFQKDPAPVLELLELLKDDPELYVRRSVANSLNDIGKDHPEVLVKTARRWMKDADENRQWVIKHALRSAIKRGDAGALSVLGFGREAQVEVIDARIAPRKPRIGTRVQISFALTNNTRRAQDVLVDFCIHYVKANGTSSRKVFKLKQLRLPAGDTVRLEKAVSLQEMTTRKHYPGVHKVAVLLNGKPHALGVFHLQAA